ncbi:hypothetical protein MRB53_020499 [Persea americana]|uniref:Uncharacterized protein n=1 Tax=Persea americana TaxID=3435 RepID=A0ACC2L122_PERAE|nr:hypothetical protein MRB53_020499 [Persea americana]
MTPVTIHLAHKPVLSLVSKSKQSDANEGRVLKNAYNRARRQQLKMDKTSMQPGSSGAGGPRGSSNHANEDHADINHVKITCDNDNHAYGLHAEDDSHTDGLHAEDKEKKAG